MFIRKVFLVVIITVSIVLMVSFTSVKSSNVLNAAKSVDISSEDNKNSIDSIDYGEINGRRDLNEITSANISQKTIDDLVKKINVAQKNYDKQLEIFKKRIIIMYQLTDSTYSDAFMNSKSIFDYYRRVDILTKIAKEDKQMLLNLSLAKKEIEMNKKIMESLKSNKLAKTDGTNLMIATKDVVGEDVAKMQLTLELIEETLNAVIEESKGTPKLVGTLVDVDADYAGGTMVWPVPSSGKITSGYGNRIHPILKKLKFHSGIDISASYRSSIVSANAGKVIFSGWKGSYGNVIIIDHGGRIATLYAHCSSLLLSKGAKVEAGQTIAKIGSTGSSTGNHLHFEVIIGNEKNDFGNVDPEKYVKR